MAPVLSWVARAATATRDKNWSAPGRILISAQMGIGNLLLFIPLLQSLRAGYPGARIALVFTQRNGADSLLDAYPGLVDEIVHLDVNKKGKLARIRQAWSLGRRGWDMAIFRFNGFQADVILAAILGRVPMRVGHGTSPDWVNPMEAILNRKVVMEPRSHEVDRYLAIAQALGLPQLNRLPVINLPAAAQAKADAALEAHDLGRRDFVVLVPGTSPAQGWKRWPDARWGELLKLLQQEGLSAVFLGSKAEADLIKGIMRLAPENQAVTAFAGELSLMESVGICQRARAVIAADTALMHLAGAVGTPVIGLFGPTDDARTGPLAVNQVLLRASFCKGSCFYLMNPESKFDCDVRRCMEGIEAARVAESIRVLMKRTVGQNQTIGIN